MVLSGRKLIEASAKQLNRKFPYKGLDFWREAAVSYIEKRSDISAFSFDLDEFTALLETEQSNKELDKAFADIEKRKKEEVRDYVIDFQSHVAEQNWRKANKK